MTLPRIQEVEDQSVFEDSMGGLESGWGFCLREFSISKLASLYVLSTQSNSKGNSLVSIYRAISICVWF